MMTDKENCPPVDNEKNIREKYQRESHGFVDAIDKYSGPDPLNLWYKYICWLDDVFNQCEDEVAVMENILQTCLATFENERMYKQDRRLIKIFIKFVSLWLNRIAM